MDFETIIGLEVHTQLNTKTKIFCSCATSFGDKANANTCPVCLALPGALPVLNKEALQKAIYFGKAVNAKLNQVSVFNRKNYFYPDLPKAYQISQFDVAIVEKGSLEIEGDFGKKIVGITRAHLEEDAGKNIHESDYSKVDLNRAGTPLLEIVSEPDMRSSDEAVAYLKKLHSIIRFLGIGDANMQEGSFRCDVNISIRPKGTEKYGTRVEIKNLNSFKFIQKAIEYEKERQVAAYMDGTYEKDIVQETRLFDTTRLVTKPMRSKEEAADYRYFKDPDLLPVFADNDMLNVSIPELADEKVTRYQKEYNLKEDEAKVLTSSLEMAQFFEYLIDSGCTPKLSATWLSVELMGLLKGDLNIINSPVSKEKLSDLIKAIDSSEISNRAAKDVLAYMFENGGDVSEVIEKLGLKQVSDDGAINAIIDDILSKNTDKVEEYKAGKEKLFGFFVGQVMKEGKGAFNPAKVNELLKAKL